jgi:uncharacterized protein YbbK (DUF523 family)
MQHNVRFCNALDLGAEGFVLRSEGSQVTDAMIKAKVPVSKGETEIHHRRTEAYGVLSQLPSCGSEKVLEGSGVSLRGSRGQHGDPSDGFYGNFVGILQVKIRQRVSSVRMLRIIVCEGNIR